MQNPYQTLGVNREATADEIKRAYRKLASQHHPDRGGDTQRFQEIQVAYDTLTDPQRREAMLNPGFGVFDFQSIFDVFGTRFQQAQRQQAQHARMSLWVTLQDIAQDSRKTVSVGTPQGTQVIEIDIPAGINDGDTVQYPGIGPGGIALLITYRIHPNPKWTRQGPNLTTDHAVSVWDLIQGGTITVRDILGTNLSLTIPARSQPGTVFRLRGRGLAQRGQSAGDLLVRVQAIIPDHIPDAVLVAIAEINN